MDAKDIADLFTAATARVEFYWNFYVVLLIALFGWLLSRERPLGRGLKVVLSAGYVVFALMNVLGLWGSYTFADALRRDLVAMPGLEAVPESRALLGRIDYRDQRAAMLLIHGVMAAVVLAAIWRVRLAPGTPPPDER